MLSTEVGSLHGDRTAFVSRLTHSYFLSGTDHPECSACHCPLTVKYILIEYPALTSTRNKHFTSSSMKDLFDNVAARNIDNFMKDPMFIALYNVVTAYFILAQSLDLNIVLPYHYNYLLSCVHCF